MSHQLFTELSLEQQETVSGGAIADAITTNFNQILQTLNFNVSSTAAGSTVNQLFAANEINTAAAKAFAFDPANGVFDPSVLLVH